MNPDGGPPLSRRAARALLAASAASAATGRADGQSALALIARPIPSTGETIPAVGLGTWRTF
ncbi:MAG TPA: aldo/keto reductase, partial [Methylomirabilota bacterium]|nr:aldo/keto reductase [Methylomirabilota bacterium]